MNGTGCKILTRIMIGCLTEGATLVLVALILLSLLGPCCLSMVEDYYNYARRLHWEVRMIFRFLKWEKVELYNMIV